MYLYLADGKTIEDLDKYGFRDCGECYKLIAVYESEVLGLVGQDTFEINKDSGKATFISMGKNNQNEMLKLAERLCNRGILVRGSNQIINEEI